VSYFFNEWQKYFERVRNDPDFLKANIQLQIENEDDLKVAKNLALLYGRKERNLPPKALKLLFQIYNSPVFSHAIALNPKEKIVRGLISLVLSMERRSRMHDEAKVSKDLLLQQFCPQSATHDSSHPEQVDALFVQTTQNKAKKIRSEIFQILKRVSHMQQLDQRQSNPVYGYNAYKQ